MKLEELLPVHFNSPPPVPVLSQLNPVHIPPSTCSRYSASEYHPSTNVQPAKWHLNFRLPIQTLCAFPSPPPSLTCLIISSQHIRGLVRDTNYIAVHYVLSLSSYYFLLLNTLCPYSSHMAKQCVSHRESRIKLCVVLCILMLHSFTTFRSFIVVTRFTDKYQPLQIMAAA